jgi:hypothetical protein
MIHIEYIILIYVALLVAAIMATVGVVALIVGIREAIHRKRAAQTPLIGVVLPRDMKE